MLAEADHTIQSARAAGASARRAIATASKLSARKPSALDRAIAAADEFMAGDYPRISAAHSAAEEAAIRWDDALENRAEAAAAAVLVPKELCFETNPATELVRMELHYADGHGTIHDYVRLGFTPSDRTSLIRHCEQAGLKPKRYLAAWDNWKRAQRAASDAVMPASWHEAQATFEAAEREWDAALDRQRMLANAIMKIRVTTAADALRQVDAYARTVGLADPVAYADHEDALTIASSLIRSLQVMAEQVSK